VFVLSVVRRLPPETTLTAAAFMWRRHHLMVPFTAAAAVGLGVVAALFGFETGGAIAVGLAGGAVAATASTRYQAVALTDRGLMVMPGSRIRQVAVGEATVLPRSTEVRLVSNVVIYADWDIGGQRWSVPRRHEKAMSTIAAASGGERKNNRNGGK
jgi:hypothetical protein